MKLINNIKENFNKNPRAWGSVAAFVGMFGAFGWKIACGILCVILLREFIMRD